MKGFYDYYEYQYLFNPWEEVLSLPFGKEALYQHYCSLAQLDMYAMIVDSHRSHAHFWTESAEEQVWWQMRDGGTELEERREGKLVYK